MPPRRSSRARASVEPAPPPSKRKRDVPQEVEDEEEDVKPAPRTRRSTSARPESKTRTTTRSRKSLEEVQEEDEEVEAPVKKKSRPSLETEEEEEEAEAAPKTRARKPSSRASAAAPSTTTSAGKKTRGSSAKVKAESSEISLPRRKTVAPATAAKRSTKNTPTIVIDSDHEDGAEVDENGDLKDIQPLPKRGKQKTVYVIEDSDDEPQTSSKPKAKGRARGRDMTPVKEEVAQEDEEEVKQEGEEEPSAQAENSAQGKGKDEGDLDAGSAAVPDEPGNGAQSSAEEPFEEEHSLLDPPLSSAPPMTSQAAPAPEEPSGPIPRLVIHKLVLVNFKSYAGRQEIGPFHKSFSAIVGPNGSGKSNTIDALLFVFGYRASKMRQGKLSELIHNSANYPDLPECSVEVHFREIIDLPGPDKFETVPDSQLVVTRTASRNNSSRYTINGRGSNYGEVQKLLKGRGIDLDHNRFLILQGEVESIAQMKPKGANENDDGLLEYLEDIIGTAQYKAPIEEALAEVERLTEERQEKLNRLRIVEKDRKSLESKKQEAEDYLRLVNNLVRARSRLWQYYIWQCLENEGKLETKLNDLESTLAAEREANADKLAALEAAEAELRIKEEQYHAVKEAAAACVKDYAAQERTQISLEEKRKHANTKTKKLKKAIQDEENSRNAARRTIEDTSEKIEKATKDLETHEADLAEAENVLQEIQDSLKDKTQVFHDQIEVKQKELEPWTKKINSQKAEIDLKTSERDALKKKAEEAKAALESLEAEVEELQVELRASQTRRQELLDGKAKNQREIKEAERQLEAAERNVQALRAKSTASRQKAEEAKSSQERSRSNNHVLDSLTRLKTSGRIDGFYGRLGSLGTIPDKYDVAISTAALASLNNMVVDTVQQGQACIDYLRSQKVGRASFMVLEKLGGRGMDRVQTPEDVPRLFDLIKPKDPRFAPAFYKAVHNTLVADNLEQANRIAFGAHQRWRVVTLDGQLIDASGTMSGGGTTVQRGGMSSKLAPDAVSPDVILKYERDSETDDREYRAALAQHKELELKLDNLRKATFSLDLDKVDLDIKNCTSRIQESERSLKERRAQCKPEASDLARISALEKEIAAGMKQHDKLKLKSGEIEEEMRALESKIIEIGGARLLSQKSIVDGLRLRFKVTTDALAKYEPAKIKAESDLKKHEGNIKKHQTELEEAQEELEEHENQLQEVTELMSELHNKVQVAQAAEEEWTEKLTAMKTELEEMSGGVQGFQQRQQKLEHDISDVKRKYNENKTTMDHWMAQHDDLQLEDVDDEEPGEETPERGDPGNDPEGSGDGDGPVKKDSDVRRSRERTPSHELRTYQEAELRSFKRNDLIADVELLDEQVKGQKPDLSVLKDYQKRAEEWLKRAHDLTVMTQTRDAKKAEYDALTKQRLDEFMAGFSAISLKLKEMYQMITLGGNAELELVDSMDPFSEGIIFSVMPPKKSWKNISNLSGGEKTLSSLALVFALHVYKPTPLYFMDEIDAALDFRNVSIVANYIKDRTKNAQFIIISLRNDMFELSHRLIGIYKTANATRSISIDNHSLATIPITAVPVAN